MKTARLVFVSTPYASIECRDKDRNYYAKQIEHQACSLMPLSIPSPIYSNFAYEPNSSLR